MKYTHLIIGLLIGGIVVFIVSGERHATSSNAQDAPTACTEYPHISDSACENPIIKKIPYGYLRYEIEKYISAQKEKGVITDVGIYFRDLNNGPTLGINEHFEFIPASMLKVGTLIAYLTKSENDPEILSKTTIISQDTFERINSSATQNYKPTKVIQANTQYTVEDLLHYSIVYSDNIATTILNEHMKEDALSGENTLMETFQSLGIYPSATGENFALSTKRYAQIFSVLYYSSFLPPEKSEYALTLLLQTDFPQGIVAGVPTSVPVAHKFGERTILAHEETEEIKQLHDCGIVYYPENPYLLCVMTRGKEYVDLEKTISTISSMFYKEVDSRKIYSNK
jgi:beta-lactamase class A